MTTILNDTEIQQLFQFCRKHYVRYYDVQVELVDHLANAIEQKLNTNPNLNFEKALDEVYKGFGITGFRKIIVAKEKALAKEHKVYYLQELKSYFTLPKVMLTLLCATLLFSFYHQFKTNVQWLYGFAYASTLVILFFDVLFTRKCYKVSRQPKRELLSATPQIPLFFFYGSCYIQFNFLLKPLWGAEYNAGNMHGFYWLMGVLNVVSLITVLVNYTVNVKVMEKAKSQYPLAFE